MFYHPSYYYDTPFGKLNYLLSIWVFLMLSMTAFGQETLNSSNEPDNQHQISLKHDNDFLVFSDRYYSSGLFFSYRKLLKKGLFKSGKEQISFILLQQIYTPSKLNTSNRVEMDRPYAGYQAISTEWSYIKDRYVLENTITLGLIGKASGAGSFHRWYHNALEVPNPPTWAYELANKLHLNLYTSFLQEWQLAPNNFSVYVAIKPTVALGTKDTYLQPEFIAHFGRRQPIHASMAYNRIGSSKKEVFLSIRAGYRFIAHNALLEGHLFGDNSSFLTTPKKGFFYGGLDIKHRFKNNDYWMGYRFNSAETNQTKAHKYVILSYARNF